MRPRILENSDYDVKTELIYILAKENWLKLKEKNDRAVYRQCRGEINNIWF